MIGGFIGSIRWIQIFCHEKVQNNMWCSLFFITDDYNFADTKDGFLEKKNISQTPKISYFSE